jgi:mono/diheme cytochrome c family protein
MSARQAYATLCLSALALLAAAAGAATGGDPIAGEAESARLDVARIELGRATYDQHCASCHGLNGEGQADWKIPNADGSLPAPPHNVSGHTWHHAEAQLLDIIAQGGTIYMPESTMPGFEDLLSQAEMEATLAYIKRWWGPDELDFQAEVSASWPTAEAP